MKKNKRILQEINITRTPANNLILLRLLLDDDFTAIEFGYVAPFYYKRGGWIRIDQQTHINNGAKRFKLLRAENIPLSPDSMHFESIRDWQFFTLYFEPIPKIDQLIDIIESQNPNSNDFNFYSIAVEMDKCFTIFEPEF